MIRKIFSALSYPFRGLAAWLKRVPIDDYLDRRNAPFLQVVLLLIIGWAPISASIALWQSLQQPRLDYLKIASRLTDDVLGITCVCVSLWLVRRGKLRAATKLFLVFLSLSMAAAYIAVGIEKIPADLLPLLLLAIGGQILGRRALWLVFSAMFGSLVASYLSDVLVINPGPLLSSTGLIHVATIGVIYLTVAVVIDQTVVALRLAIIDSNERAKSLEQLSRQLQIEIFNHRLAEEKLMHIHKIEAVNRIAAGVAHDFGNILSVISGYTDQCESISDRGMPAMIEALEDIGAAARSAHRLNRQLLDFSRRSTTRNEIFDLAQATAAAMKLVRMTFAGNVQVTLKSAGTALPVLFDRSHFDLIALNLAANARDAMPNGGSFHIECFAQDNSALVCFKDSGSGMDASIVQQLFEPFFTTKGVGKGTGLGLTLAAELLRNAEGTIEVSSIPGIGSEFRIRLPMAATQDEPSLALERVAKAADGDHAGA